MYAITRPLAAFVLLITPWTGALAQSPDLTVHTRELLPPPHADFHDRMGGWPTELTPRTFHAARGTLVIYAHGDERTDLVFDFQGLLPYGFMADPDGRAHVTVNLDHRPGREFLLDYHADGHVRGGEKGKTVFPGVLWARFPNWETD
jgi:hypothetical protein